MNRLSRGERIAAIAAVLLLIDTFLDWYGSNLGGRTWDAWGAFAGTDVLLAILVALTLAWAALRAIGRPLDLSVSPPLVIASLGALLTVIVLYRIVNQPGDNAVIDVRYGAYLGLVLCAAVAYGAVGDPAPP